MLTALLSTDRHHTLLITQRQMADVILHAGRRMPAPMRTLVKRIRKHKEKARKDDADSGEKTGKKKKKKKENEGGQK